MISNASKSGLILGVLAVALTFISYIVDSSLLAAWWLGFLFLGLFMVYIIIQGVKYRKEETEEGYLSYGKAFQYSFVVFAISGIFGTLARILLFEVIDPDLVGILTEQLMEQQIAMLESFGTPASTIDDQMETMRAATEEGMSTGGLLKGYLWAMIFYVICSLITAAFIKKSEPEEQF